MEQPHSQTRGSQGADEGRSQYPLGVPSKFDIDGNVQIFPGNTIISHLAPSSELYASLLILHKKLRESRFSSILAMLPPPSWHMTVFEGVCDQVRKSGYWPSDMSIDATLEDCTSVFAEKLARFDLQCDPPYRLRIDGIDPLEIGIGLHLVPASEEEEVRLRHLRDRLSGLLKIRHPGHANYGLHLSVAYLTRHLTEEQRVELSNLLMDHLKVAPLELELGAPEFCTFSNMFRFERQFYLHDQKGQTGSEV